VEKPLTSHLPSSVNSGTVFWFFGLSGAGKSTVASAMLDRLRNTGRESLWLDGDDLRRGICRDLGFSPADRLENVRRAAGLAREACERGVIVLVSLMTPERAMRQAAIDVLSPFPCYPIHLACDYVTCAERDSKGLYHRAEQGQVSMLPGRDLLFEPAAPEEFTVDSQHQSREATFDAIDRFVMDRLPGL
jgi:adenylylsulfate kinase